MTGYHCLLSATPHGARCRSRAAFFASVCLLVTSSLSAMAQDIEGNPLPLCPDKPNCVRESHVFVDAQPDELFEHARDALISLDPAEIDTTGARRLEAVFTVFLFKDDVQLAVTEHDEGSALHIRSASRVGGHDLGVNRRRVNRFLKALEDRL